MTFQDATYPIVKSWILKREVVEECFHLFWLLVFTKTCAKFHALCCEIRTANYEPGGCTPGLFWSRTVWYVFRKKSVVTGRNHSVSLPKTPRTGKLI